MSAAREVSRDLTTLVAHMAKLTDDCGFGEDVTISATSYGLFITQLMAIAADVAELEDSVTYHHEQCVRLKSHASVAAPT